MSPALFLLLAIDSFAVGFALGWGLMAVLEWWVNR